MYIYLKDKANNISVTTDKSTAKIIVDQTKPSVTLTLTGAADEGQTLSDPSTYTHTKNIKYNASITESNIDSYCVYEDSCNYQTTGSTTLNTSYTLKDTEGSHSVKIRVKDKAGNESEINTTSTKSITLDKTNPTATISKNTQDTSSITVTVGYEGQDSIIAKQCRISSPTVGEWKNTEPEGSCKISNLSDGTQYTIQARVRDASGRWNTDYPSVIVTTDKKGYPASALLSNPPKGLTVTDCEGTKRFVGHCNAANDGCKGIVDNFVCFGYANESDCKVALANNEYIYRIIGITSKGEMKLIKNKALAQTYKWHNSNSDILWNESDLFSNLNSLAYLTKLSSTWQDKIEKYNWSNGYIGMELYSDAKEVCELERNMSKVSAKIGLLSVGEYYYANDLNGTSCWSSDCSTNWLFIKMNSVSSMLSEYDWMILRDSTGGYLKGWSVFVSLENSKPMVGDMNQNESVRPVFYLSSDALISSGNGTSTDPFIIAK